jgi:hypothetical protein
LIENAEAGLTQWNVSTEGSFNGLNWDSSLEKPMHDSQTFRVRPAEGDINASGILTYKTPIAIPAGGTTTLNFQDWYMGESDDGVVVEVSENGTTWTAVYTDLRSDLAPVAAELFATEGLFSREVDLTSLKGKTVQLRFRNFVGAENKPGSTPAGWFVDNISIINDNWTDVVTDTSGTSFVVSARPSGTYCYRVNTSYTLGSVVARSSFSNIVNAEVAAGVVLARLQNLSARARVQTDDNVLIGGFIVTDAPKRVVVRAIGPSMQSGGAAVPGRLTDTTLELYAQGNTTPIASNDDWQTNQAEIEATNLAPTDPHESAIVITLNPGAYTAVVKGKNREVGLGLVEIYDVNMSAGSTLRNISARAFVESDDNVLIGGLIAGPSNSGPTRVVFRAIGPSLKSQLPNALDDTILEVRDANGSPVTNDDWQQSPDAAAIQQAGLAPSHPAESAVLISSLAAGAHTAIVRGKGNPSGVGLVEVYNLQ